MLLSVVLIACSAAGATVLPREMGLTAAGDTIFAWPVFRVNNSPDSVSWSITAKNATQRVSVIAPANNITLTTGPVALVPVPALAEGDTAMVRACPTAYKRTATPPIVTGFLCLSRVYTRPATPPIVIGDSLKTAVLTRLRISPDWVIFHQGVGIKCAYDSVAGGWRLRSTDSDPGCGLTPAARVDPGLTPFSRYRLRVAQLRPYFDSIEPDPWDVYRAATLASARSHAAQAW